MLCAKGKAPPPPPLVASWWCEEWNTLPNSGGLYDQDYKEMYRLSYVRRCHRAVHKWRLGLERTADETNLFRWLIASGYMQM